MSAAVHPLWSTGVTDQPPDTSPMELSALGEHRDRCTASRGQLFALQRAEESLLRFFEGHVWTTLLFVALLIALIAVVYEVF